MKVYGVGEGEYEQYGIFAIYTNRDHADAVARAHGGDVQEFDLDESLTEAESAQLRPGERTYRVRLDAGTPQVWAEWAKPPLARHWNARQDAFVTCVWAFSEKAAIVAAEAE